MSMGMAAMTAKAGTSPAAWTAPSTCPLFPGAAAATTAGPLALIAVPVSLPVLLARPHSPVAGRAAARVSQIRTRSGRAPPASQLS